MDNLDTRTTIGRLEGRLVPAAPKKARSESSKGRLNGRLEVVEAGRENESTRKTDKQPRGNANYS